MKTALALIAVTCAAFGGPPVFGLSEAEVPAVGHLRHLDEAPPVNPAKPESNLGGMPPTGFEDGQWLEADPMTEDDERRNNFRGNDRWGCYPGSWHWPGCRWGGGGGGCYPGSWGWPRCRNGHW